jgi:AAA+ superfamily predicted ATPase
MIAASAPPKRDARHDESFRGEHPVAASVRLRAMRKALWMRQLWAQEPGAAHPAAISHEEVDRILSEPAELAEREAAFYRDDPSAAALSRAIAEADPSQDESWQRLIQVFSLDPTEEQLFSLAVAQALEPSLGRAFAYLHDQPELTYPTTWLAAALCGPLGETAVPLQKDSALIKWRLIARAPESIPVQGVWTGWIADPLIVAWLERGGVQDLPDGATLYTPEMWVDAPALYPEILASATEFLNAIERAPAAEIEFLGPDGSGRCTLAAQIAARAGKSLIAVSETELLEGVPETDTAQAVLLAARSAHLRGSILYWRDARDPSPAARRALRSTATIRIVGRTAQHADAPPPHTVFRSLELPPLTRSAREQLWNACSPLLPPSQVREWLLTPGEIVQLSRVAHAGDEAIQQACRRPVESLNLLVRLPLPFDPAQLILPPAIEKALDDFENQVRFRWDVYEQWGFERLCPNGRGLIALFAGPSGTGKTMAAQVLARRLGLELYRLDPAQVVNKYIGETEKRLKAIFDECDRAHFLLLIDECEGMFGQRFSSKDAHDRYANLEIDYLLQRLERFQGVAVLSTNRKGDLDSGFLRRIRFIIDFMPPGPAERLRLWASALPTLSPSGEALLQSSDWSELAERVPLTGAEINLAALNAAFLARAANQKIALPHVLEAVKRELAKKGQTLRGFE